MDNDKSKKGNRKNSESNGKIIEVLYYYYKFGLGKKQQGNFLDKQTKPKEKRWNIRIQNWWSMLNGLIYIIKLYSSFTRFACSNIA